jgi:hypothetical protein
MKYRLSLALLALAGFALAGCGRSTGSLEAGTTAPAGSDQDQVNTALAQNPDYVNEDLYQSSASQSYDDGTGLAAIKPLRFWRNITGITSTFDTEFGPPDSSGRPTTALVTIHRHLTGTFNIVAGVATPEDTSRSLVQKPLDDHWTRRIALQRLPDLTASAFTRWRLVGTSGVDVRTRGGVTRVQSVRIQTAEKDTTITDPLELHRLRRMILLPALTDVNLTVTTGNSSDVVLFYGHDMRRRFTNNGDGTFSFHFISGRAPGVRNFGVDALSNGTLFDDSAAYDSNAWIFGYVVTPTRLPIAS